MAKTNSLHPNLERLVLSNVLLKQENELIRRFLDGRLRIHLKNEGDLKFFTCLERTWIEVTKDILSTNQFINFPLMFHRIKSGVPEIYEKIVKKNGETALHKCAFENLKYLAESFLRCFENKHLLNYLDLGNSYCETAFHYAASNMNFEFAMWLLEKGTKNNIMQFKVSEVKDANYLGEGKLSPADGLLITYSKEKARILVVRDTKVIKTIPKSVHLFELIEMRNHSYKLNALSDLSLLTLLNLAIERDSSEEITLLLPLLKKSSLQHSDILVTAAKKRNKFVLIQLLEKGADINAAEITNNFTPVNIAAREEYWDIVLELIEKGADVTLPSSKNYTVLYWAATEGREDVVLRTLDAGGDIDAIETLENFTPVIGAAEQGHWDIVLKLIERGANVTLPSLTNCTVLFFAALAGKLDVVLKLIEKKADINAVELSTNLTPINAAALKGHWDIVHELIFNDAKLDVPEKRFHNTVLHFAAQQGKFYIVTELLNHNAKIDPVNIKNQTPVLLAALSNHWNIVFELLSRGADIYSGHGDLKILELAETAGRLDELKKFLLKKK